MPGTFSLPLWVSNPNMHHGTCVTHVPWCMLGSLASGFLCIWWRGETFPAFLVHAQPTILRIWQEARGVHVSLPWSPTWQGRVRVPVDMVELSRRYMYALCYRCTSFTVPPALPIASNMYVICDLFQQQVWVGGWMVGVLQGGGCIKLSSWSIWFFLFFWA